MIQSLCRPETVPEDYLEVVNEYAQHGYRLIAVARKSLDMGYAKASKIARGVVRFFFPFSKNFLSDLFYKMVDKRVGWVL